MRKKFIIGGFGLILVASLYIFIHLIVVTKPITSKNIIKVRPLNQWDGFSLEGVPVFFELMQENYLMEESSTLYDITIDGVFGDFPLGPFGKKVLFSGESRLKNIDKYDLALGSDFINAPNYFRLPLYLVFKNKLKTDFKRGKCNPKKKYFACFLVSNGGDDTDHSYENGCYARNHLFKELNKYKKVSSGGKHLNNIGYVVAPDKSFEWLNNCKFVIAYENRVTPGYITEKLFQAYFSGAIPIYNGHTSTTNDFNKEATVYAHDFRSESEIIEYIKMLDNDDELYCKKWNEELITKEEQTYEYYKARLKEKMISLNLLPQAKSE